MLKRLVDTVLSLGERVTLLAHPYCIVARYRGVIVATFPLASRSMNITYVVLDSSGLISASIGPLTVPSIYECLTAAEAAKTIMLSRHDIGRSLAVAEALGRVNSIACSVDIIARLWGIVEPRNEGIVTLGYPVVVSLKVRLGDGSVDNGARIIFPHLLSAVLEYIENVDEVSYEALARIITSVIDGSCIGIYASEPPVAIIAEEGVTVENVVSSHMLPATVMIVLSSLAATGRGDVTWKVVH